MESISALWKEFTDFLLRYDFKTIAEMVYSIDWVQLAHNPVAWAIVILVVGIIVISKRYQYLILILSIAALFFVFYRTIPENTEEIQFQKLLVFMFSTMAIVGLNIYFLIIRR